MQDDTEPKDTITFITDFTLMPSYIDLVDAGESITVDRLSKMLDITVPFFSKDSIQTADSIVLTAEGKIRACHLYVEKNTPYVCLCPTKPRS